MAWYQYLLCFYIAFSIVTFIIVLAIFIDEPYEWIIQSPIQLYEKTNMNWFGCIFIWFLEFLLMPVPVILSLIWDFFNWLVHVGRKD